MCSASSDWQRNHQHASRSMQPPSSPSDPPRRLLITGLISADSARSSGFSPRDSATLSRRPDKMAGQRTKVELRHGTRAVGQSETMDRPLDPVRWHFCRSNVQRPRVDIRDGAKEPREFEPMKQDLPVIKATRIATRFPSKPLRVARVRGRYRDAHQLSRHADRRQPVRTPTPTGRQRDWMR